MARSQGPGSKGGGPEPVRREWQGAEGGGAGPGANGGEPGAKGGGKVEESQAGSKGGGKGQEGTVCRTCQLLGTRCSRVTLWRR